MTMNACVRPVPCDRTANTSEESSSSWKSCSDLNWSRPTLSPRSAHSTTTYQFIHWANSAWPTFSA